MIRVLLADDHAVVRAGVREILAATGDIEIVAEAANGVDAIGHVHDRTLDVAVIDLSMPGRSGIDLIRRIKTERPRLKVLVLSMHSEDQYAVRAIKAGASGYITKESAADQLVAAVRKVAAGGAFISAEIAQRLALDATQQTTRAPHDTLSDREYQVFRMIVAGRTPTEIAAALSLSIKTVSTHKLHILHKMGMISDGELIRYAIRHGLDDDQPDQPSR
ncbi:MAG TPA: response regulator transcription factor [Gammaproteobacteria bacterium]|jgi:DNA-binding NarL/FixJ family response regulator|nr:response regulator transcription factor [Gammaproteobacteria bacterium]